MKEAAITTAKDRSKGELRLRQRREDARRFEGVGAMTADRTSGDDDHARRRRQVQLEGCGAGIEGGGGGGGRVEVAVAAAKNRRRRRRRVGTRWLLQPLAKGG